MEYSKLTDAILKLSTQMEELVLSNNEIREILTKQRNEELLKRLDRLESSMKNQHIKLDALNAIDINPTIVVPSAPATVRVAGTKAKKDKLEDKREDNIEETEEPDDTKELKLDENKQFSNITEYFKYLWMTCRDTLYEKDVLTKQEYDKIYEDNKDKFDKKKKNELVLQKSIAFQIWKVLPQARKDIVYAMKNQNSNDLQKKNSTEIVEEDEA